MKLFKYLLVFICLFCFANAESYPTLPEDLDKYLYEQESQFTDIIPNTEKKIVWDNEDTKKKTEYSVVYLHGFSASRQEIAPVCDDIADNIDANLFYTRFTGHGRTGDAMGQATLDEWKEDVMEAVAIGKSIGENVIVIGTSTGATLATWFADKHPEEKNITYILISPNFGVRNRGAKLLGTPLIGRLIANTFIKDYSREVETEEEAKYWTIEYPTKAIIPMMQAVKESKKIKYSNLQQKMMVLHTDIDNVVDSEETDKIFVKLKGGNKELVIIDNATQKGHHVLAGDIMSPETTDEVEEKILNFIK